MRCSVCGVELKDTDRFCGICGTPNPNLAPSANSENSVVSDSDSVADDVVASDEVEVSGNKAENTDEVVDGEAREIAQEESFDTEMVRTEENEVGGQASEIDPQKKEEGTNGVKFPQNEVRFNAPPTQGVSLPPPPQYTTARAQQTGKPQKEKRVCSLGAVVFCIIVILILSLLCGVLGGLYLSERNLRIRTEQRHSAYYSDYYSNYYSERDGGFYGQYRK